MADETVNSPATEKAEKEAKASKSASKKGPGPGKRMGKFFRDTKGEFKKIIWPDNKSLARQTGAVVATSVVLGLVIALLDFLIQYGVDFLVGLSF